MAEMNFRPSITRTLEGRVKFAYACNKTDEEIAEKEGISVEKVADILKRSRLPIVITSTDIVEEIYDPIGRKWVEQKEVEVAKLRERIVELESRSPIDVIAQPTLPLYRVVITSTTNVRDKDGTFHNEVLLPGMIIDVWAEVAKIGGHSNRAVIDPPSNSNPRNVWLNNLRRLEAIGGNSAEFFWPTYFRVVTQRYGENPNKYGYGAMGHDGLDLRAPLGSNIYACLDGIAVLLPNFGVYGNTIRVVSGKYRVEYCHLCKFLISAGRVKRGQVLGLAGETGQTRGAHLHLNLFVDGKRVDPAPYLGV